MLVTLRARDAARPRGTKALEMLERGARQRTPEGGGSEIVS